MWFDDFDLKTNSLQQLNCHDEVIFDDAAHLCGKEPLSWLENKYMLNDDIF